MSALGTVRDVVAAGCLLGGGVLSVTAGLGLLRFPDVLSRMHAATKPQVVGVLLAGIGAGLLLADTPAAWTLALVALFQLLTAPLGAHMVSRIAYRRRHVRRDLLVVDEVGDLSGGPPPDLPAGDDSPAGGPADSPDPRGPSAGRG